MSDEALWGHETRRLSDELGRSYRRIVSNDAPTEAEVVPARRTLAAAWDEMASAAEAAGRDEAVRRHVRNAVTSLRDAATTVLDGMIPVMVDSSREESG